MNQRLLKATLLSALALLLLSPAHGVLQNLDPGLVTSVANTRNDAGWGRGQYNTGFYAQSRYWQFDQESGFFGSCEHEGGCLAYRSSADPPLPHANVQGTSWTTLIPTSLHVTSKEFSVYSNSTHVFYARYNETFELVECNKNLMFGYGTLVPATGTINWQPEVVVRSAAATKAYEHPFIVADDSNPPKLYIGYQNRDSSGSPACGGTGAIAPSVTSASFPYTSWSADTVMTNDVGTANWQIDLVSLGGGNLYATYWHLNDIFGKRYDAANGQWELGVLSEAVTPGGSATARSSFLFNDYGNPVAVWYDRTSELLRMAERVPASFNTSSSFTPIYDIAAGEASITSPLIAASFDSYTTSITVFWYNYTLSRLDAWQGWKGSWTSYPNILSGAGLCGSNPPLSPCPSGDSTDGLAIWSKSYSVSTTTTVSALVFTVGTSPNTVGMILPLYFTKPSTGGNQPVPPGGNQPVGFNFKTASLILPLIGNVTIPAELAQKSTLILVLVVAALVLASSVQVQIRRKRRRASLL